MEIGALTISEDQGVPLEHLISCVKGVGIVNVAGHKRLQWAGKNDQSQDNGIQHLASPHTEFRHNGYIYFDSKPTMIEVVHFSLPFNSLKCRLEFVDILINRSFYSPHS